jgi:hypothetical protein
MSLYPEDQLIDPNGNNVDTVARYKLILQRYPSFVDRPDVVKAMADNPNFTPDQLLKKAGSLYAAGAADTLQKHIESLSPAAQRAQWSMLTPEQQRTLEAGGYKQTYPDENGLSGFLALPGSIVGTGVQAISKVVSPVLKPVMHAMAWGGEQVNHSYRANRSMEETNQDIALAAGAVAATAAFVMTDGLSAALTAGALSGVAASTLTSVALNHEEFANAWRNTSEATQSFTLPAIAKAKDWLGDPTLVGMAKTFADTYVPSGEKPYDMFEIARQVAAVDGGLQEQIPLLSNIATELAGTDPELKKRVYANLLELAHEDDFQKAVQALQAGRISVGDDLVRLVDLDPNSTAGQFGKNAANIAWMFIADPIMGGNHLNEWRKVSQTGMAVEDAVSGGARFADISRNVPKVKRLHEAVAAFVESGQTARLSQEAPSWAMVATELIDYRNLLWHEQGLAAGVKGTFSHDDLINFIVDHGKMSAIMRGAGTVRGGREVMLAGTTATNALIKNVVSAMRELNVGITEVGHERQIAKLIKPLIDDGSPLAMQVAERFAPSSIYGAIDANGIIKDQWLFDKPWQYGSDVNRVGKWAKVQDKAHDLGRVLGRVPGLPSLSDYAQMVTTMVPQGPIALVGPKAAPSVHAMTETAALYNMPAYARHMWRDAILESPTISGRMRLIGSFMESALKTAGIQATEEGQRLYAKFVSRNLHIHGYGPGLEFVENGIMRSQTPWLHEMATDLPMPDVNAIRHSMQGLIAARLSGVGDWTRIEPFIDNWWKPAVLMKPGFVLRAGGEEMASHLVRGGMGSLISEASAAKIAHYDAYQDIAKAIENDPYVALTREQRVIFEQGPLPFFMRSTAQMLSNYKWTHPIVSIIEKYGEILHDLTANGVLTEVPGLRSLAPTNLVDSIRRGAQTSTKELGLMSSERLALNMRNHANSIFFGNATSWRRLALGGADENLVRSARAFAETYAHGIAEEVSAANHGVWTKDNGDFDMVTVPVKQADGSVVNQRYLATRSEFATTDPDSIFHAPQVHMAAIKPFIDPVTERWARENVARVLPVNHLPVEQYVDWYDWYARFENKGYAQSVIDTYMTDDSWAGINALVHKVGKRDEVIINSMLTHLTEQNHSIQNFMDALEEADMQSVASFTGTGLNQSSDRLRRILKELRANSYHRVDEMHQLGMDISKDVHKHLVSTLRTASGMGKTVDEFANEVITAPLSLPGPKLYRQIKFPHTQTILPDGSLVLHGQAQSHWDGLPGLSFAVNPRFATAYGEVPHLSTMLEIDQAALETATQSSVNKVFGEGYPHNSYENDVKPGLYKMGPEGEINYNFSDFSSTAETRQLAAREFERRVSAATDLAEQNAKLNAEINYLEEEITRLQVRHQNRFNDPEFGVVGQPLFDQEMNDLKTKLELANVKKTETEQSLANAKTKVTNRYGVTPPPPVTTDVVLPPGTWRMSSTKDVSNMQVVEQQARFVALNAEDTQSIQRLEAEQSRIAAMSDTEKQIQVNAAQRHLDFEIENAQEKLRRVHVRDQEDLEYNLLANVQTTEKGTWYWRNAKSGGRERFWLPEGFYDLDFTDPKIQKFIESEPAVVRARLAQKQLFVDHQPEIDQLTDQILTRGRLNQQALKALAADAPSVLKEIKQKLVDLRADLRATSGQELESRLLSGKSASSDPFVAQVQNTMQVQRGGETADTFWIEQGLEGSRPVKEALHYMLNGKWGNNSQEMIFEELARRAGAKTLEERVAYLDDLVTKQRALKTDWTAEQLAAQDEWRTKFVRELGAPRVATDPLDWLEEMNSLRTGYTNYAGVAPTKPFFVKSFNDLKAEAMPQFVGELTRNQEQLMMGKAYADDIGLMQGQQIVFRIQDIDQAVPFDELLKNSPRPYELEKNKYVIEAIMRDAGPQMPFTPLLANYSVAENLSASYAGAVGSTVSPDRVRTLRFGRDQLSGRLSDTISSIARRGDNPADIDAWRINTKSLPQDAAVNEDLLATVKAHAEALWQETTLAITRGTTIGKVPRTQLLEDGTEQSVVHQSNALGDKVPLPVGQPIIKNQSNLMVRNTRHDKMSMVPGHREEWKALNDGIHDSKYFEVKQLSNGDAGDVMHALTGDMIADSWDTFEGAARYSPKPKYSLYDNTNIETTDVVRAYHSHPSQVRDVGAGIPNLAFGPQMQLATAENWFDTVKRIGFDKIIGPGVDAIARKRMAMHFFNQHYSFNLAQSNWLIAPELREAADLLRQKQVALYKSMFPYVNTKELAAHARELAEAEGATTVTRGVQGTGASELSKNVVRNWSDTRALGWLRGHDSQDMLDLLNRQRSVYTKAKYTSPKLEALNKAISYVAASGDARFVLLPKMSHFEYLDYVDSVLKAAKAPLLEAGDALKQWMGNARNQRHLQQSMQTSPLSEFNEIAINDLIAARKNSLHIYEAAGKYASEATIHSMVPFMDSHEFKSQFAVYAKNLLPFWYAEENFLKRWARTFDLNPAALRKMQLTYQGIRTAGVIKTDAQGRDWFVYPASTIAAEFLSKLPFIDTPEGFTTSFASPTDSMLPGVNENFGMPAFTPWLSMTLGMAARFNPEITPLTRSVLGDFASTKSAFETFIPASVTNFIAALTDNGDSASKFAGAQNQAFTLMFANGQIDPDLVNNNLELEQLYNQVSNHARILVFAQWLTGLFTPGPPTAITQLDGPSAFFGGDVKDPRQVLSRNYSELITNLGIEEGTLEFLKVYPNASITDVLAGTNKEHYGDALAATVGSTSSVSGAPLPSTEKAAAFVLKYSPYFNEFPDAAPWLIPSNVVAKEPYSQYAHDLFVSQAMTKTQTPKEVLEAMFFKTGASEYFMTKKIADQGIAAAKLNGNTDEAKRIAGIWGDWSTSFKTRHPVFTEGLADTGPRTARRAKTINQMRTIVNDPAHPDTPQYQPLKDLMANFDYYEEAIAGTSAKPISQRDISIEEIKTKWQKFLEQTATAQPEIAAFIVSVIQPASNL